LNKISKKIVALATMAAFVLTLVPAAAFAAPQQPVKDPKIEVTDVTDKTATVTVTANDYTDTDFGNVVVWATDEDGNVLERDTDVTYASTSTVNTEWDKNAVYFTDKSAVTLTATFAEGGDYTIHAVTNKISWNATTFDLLLEKDNGEAADVYIPDYDFSGYGYVVNGVVQETATVNLEDTLNTKFIVNYDDRTGTSAELSKVWVWAVADGDEITDVSNAVAFDGEKGSNSYEKVTNSNPKNVKVTFTKAGSYTLYSGVGSTLTDAQKDENILKGATVVTVNAEPVVLDKIDNVNAVVENGNANGTDKNVPITFKNGIGDLNLTDTDFAFDGVDTITITGVAKDQNGKTIQGKTITATTNKDTVVEFDKDENNVVNAVTDNNGVFTISFKMPNKENATVTLVNEEANLSYTIQIWAVKSTAQNIDRTLTDGYVLAGNDSKYGAEVYGDATTTPVSFADAVAFKITDQQGEAMTGQAAADGAKIDVRAVGKNSTLKASDLKLIWDADAGVYTLGYVDDGYAKDLVPGKYEVRVALPSQDAATVTFNVAKFGKVQDTVLAVTARDYDQSPANPNEEVMTVDDTITLGQQITVNAKYVDENGLKVPAKYVSFNFNGKAVSDWNKWNNVFATEPDIAANDSLIGTTVKVVAFNTANKQLVEKTLTVADSYTDKSLEFSSDNGAVSKDNKVNVSVVNEDGKVQQVEGYMTAWVADQSNEDAKISVDVNKNGAHDVQNGKGSLTVYADQETTADIVVVVKAGTEAYYGTLEYTFGSENAIANRTVVMTIDSTEYVVNNKIFTGDAAPYIDSNWRTMVPIRALAEAFDAEVIWNQDDETVTINFDGDTQIVMTVGETTYTVDGNEATMDTEPVNAGDRVYVPVRFAAEGLGFNVTPLYNDANLTASVVFQK
jgi:hypothetical protein